MQNNYKKFKKIVDNKSKYYGDTDFDKHLIRINKQMNKHKGRKGELLDSIMHEKSHVLHPKMKEKNIEKLASKITKHMSKKAKQSAYKPYEKK